MIPLYLTNILRWRGGKMKKILCATDGSNYSRYAAEITKSFLKIWPEAKLIVLYVTAKENYAYDLVPDAVERYEETVANQIKEEVENQLFAAWKERVQFMHKIGHPSTTICKVAKEEDADLIIMGSHGRGFIERALIGSVTLGVLNRTHIPVLVVKKPIS